MNFYDFIKCLVSFFHVEVIELLVVQGTECRGFFFKCRAPGKYLNRPSYSGGAGTIRSHRRSLQCDCPEIEWIYFNNRHSDFPLTPAIVLEVESNSKGYILFAVFLNWST